MATVKQIKMLRAGFAKTGKMEYWDDMLTGFEVQKAEDLTNEQVNLALEQLKQLGYQVKLNKHAAPDDERPGMATTKQITMLKRIWRASAEVRDKSDAALRAFVKRIAGVDAFDWIPREDLAKVKKAIESL